MGTLLNAPEGASTCNKIQLVTKIRTDIIMNWRIEFQCKWVHNPFSPIKGPKLLVRISGLNFVTCKHSFNCKSHVRHPDNCRRVLHCDLSLVPQDIRQNIYSQFVVPKVNFIQESSRCSQTFAYTLE